MSITAELHDGRTLEFPDGTEPAVIQATVKKMLGVPASDTPTVAAPKEKAGFNPLGFPEALAALATPVVGRGVGLLAGGIGAMLPGKDGQAERWLKGTQEALSYQPRSQTGKDIIGDIGSAVNWVGNSSAGKAVKEGINAIGEASPVVGAAITAAPDLAGVLSAVGPLKAADAAVKSAASNAAQSGAQTLMLKALKPTKAELASGQGQIAADTMLKYGLNPTRAGVTKLGDLIDEINTKIADKVKGSPVTVQRDVAARYVDDVVKRFSQQASPTADLNSIQKILDDYKASHPEVFSASNAQAIKQGTYRALNGKFGEEGYAAAEAQKAIARGLKDDLASGIDNLSALNAEDSALLKTLPIASSRALGDAKKSILGLAPIAHSPTGAIAYLLDKSTLGMSLTARALNKMSGKAKSPPTFPDVGPTAFNPALGYGLDLQPVPSGAVPKSALGDLTPDWSTSPGAGMPKPEGISGAGLFPSFDDPRVGTSRLKGRPQMPVQSGLIGVDDTSIAGRNWVDAAPGAVGRVSDAPMAVGGIELSRLVNMPKSANRTKLLNAFKKRYPHAAEYIDQNM